MRKSFIWRPRESCCIYKKMFVYIKRYWAWGTNQNVMIFLEVTVCMTVNSYEDSNLEQHGCINPSQPPRYALIHNVCGF
jgi:hypothetical protein